MILTKDFHNIQDLSVGEHSLEEVVELSSKGETCPDCGGNLTHSYRMSSPDDYDQEWVCLGCGNTWTT